MQTDNRCPKTAKPNISLWVALMDNPIMGTSLQEIFLALNCPAPFYTGLQRNGGKVGPRMVAMVKEDLRRERTYEKDTLEKCGYPRLTPIPVEGDGRYNNPLYWSRDKNPFQLATHSTYTRSENVTSDKKES
uniref:Mutator-like transposase domain-containing protein n=1 Tax=Magallana gigas TaxID=29159 RepID=K1PRT2_MAGGI